MGDANYRYSPWTPERRRAASEAGKARWAAKKAAEAAQRAQERAAVAPVTALRQRLRTKVAGLTLEMECARAKFFACKAAIEELTKAESLLAEASGILRKHLPQDDLQ